MHLRSVLLVGTWIVAAITVCRAELQLRWQRGDAPPVVVERVDQSSLETLFDAPAHSDDTGNDGGKVRWSISGDLKDSAELIEWSPYCSIRRLKESDQETVGAVYMSGVSLPVKPRGASQFSLNKAWTDWDREAALLVFGWEVNGELTQVKVVPLWRIREQGSEFAAVIFGLSAAEARGQALVMYFGEKGWREPRSRFKSRDEAAFRAIMRRDRAGLEAVLASGANPLKRSLDGVSLLTYAAEIGSMECMRFLIDSIPERDRTGIGEKEQASRWAAANGRLEAVQMLLNSGLQFRGDASWERGPLDAAIQGRHPEVVALLAPKASPEQARAVEASLCARGDVELVQRMVEARGGSALNERELAAALYARVRLGDVATVRWLLAHGAHPLLVDEVKGSISLGSEGGRQPTATVSRPSHPFEAGDFTRRNYSITRRSAGDEPPLNLAVRGRDLEMMELLVESGTDVDLANQSGETALILAARIGDMDMVKTLLSAGASPAASDSAGFSAIDYAAERDDLEICAKLLAAGADSARADRDGVTPMVRALRAGAVESARLLLKSSPDSLSEGPWIPSLIDRAITADAADLLAAVHRSAPAAILSSDAVSLARFCDAVQCETWLREIGIDGESVALVKPSELDASIKLKTQVKPEDPRIATVDHARTEFRVSFFVDPNGRPRGVSVGDEVERALRASTLRALDQWTFAPARRHDRPVWTRVVMNMAYDENRLAIRDRADVTQIPQYLNHLFDPAFTGNGRLVLEFVVDRFGRASDFVILHAEDMAYATARCVQIGLAEFRPAETEGVAVPYRMVYSFAE